MSGLKLKSNKHKSFENYTEIEIIHPKEHVESTIEAHKKYVNELYTIEYEFSNKLKLLLEYYKYPLENLVGTSKQIINQKEIDSIFKGISDIFQLSWTLCGELKILIHSYNHGYSNYSIAGLFQKHARQIKDCYGRYASRYLFSIVTTHNLKKINPNFKKFYKTIKKKFHLKKVELKTAFYLPIYQIQSYYDIFLRLQKGTTPTDKSYELVEDGKEFFNELSLLLKESMKRSIKIKEVYAIQKSIKECPTSLIHPYRILYKQFESITDGNDPTCLIRLVLFDDVIVIAKKRKHHKSYTYDRAADYHVIQLIDSPQTVQGYTITLLILSPFNDYNGDPFKKGNNGDSKSVESQRNEEEILARSETISNEKKFSRFFSWTFNQNITRLTLVAETEEGKNEILTAIQKRLKHLKPKPFEFNVLEAIDKYNFKQSMANLPQQISPLPDTLGISLTDEICNSLYTSIPKRLRIKRSLTLIYSMQLHGSSLSTFYEKSSSGYGNAQILVIRDVDDNIFGAFTSEPFRKQNGFYGNGETFLWKVDSGSEKSHKRTSSGHINSDNRNSKRISSIFDSLKNSFTPINSSSNKRESLLRRSFQNNINNITENKNDSGMDNEDTQSIFSIERKRFSRMKSNFSASTNSSTLSLSGNGGKVKLFLWKQTNYFFINSTNEYVSVGSGGGKYGLWFDQQMLNGRSQVCETFRNEVLSTSEDFQIVDIELWAFTTQVEREVLRTRPSTFRISKE
ncbi:hypothetical protein BCR36DRAFT_413266 [Piromyces finnis]|uniref:Oxidation resistance protein 1 n=1 Tax=Piromyces finnis TaxID=1754191 RepID=A0A1Y1V632_9FUNG|nr:hypothetical protein BCR36DRAFT_413266 [Piromyces finnis]|eukprot:ORX48116.1 hypothetical protein BCR36DRAFT_413266 [Piromyces finnis]